MIKIKLYELDKHRNECTFRPFLWAQDTLREVGIEFTQGESYDYAWIAQSSFLNKKASLEESVDTGLNFLSKITGDYMLLDGQDSTSLMGTYEVFKESNALLLLKNSLLKDKSLYEQGWMLGRNYWGPGEYKPKDFSKFSNKIVLSGTNWLSTHWAGINVKWNKLNPNKQYDLSAMFSYPSDESIEHDVKQNIYYDKHRKPSINVINNLKYNIVKLENGKRVSPEEYHQKMYNSKIIFAPFGYGEMAPRDLEAAMYGSILLKPNMDHLQTNPNVYIDGETYISCKHDYSDFEDKVDYILSNYKELYPYIINNARKKFIESMHPNNIALHLYDIFRNLPSITGENTTEPIIDLSLKEINKIQSVVNICNGMCFDQYKAIYNCIKSKDKPNVLVFGVGGDSNMWHETNKGGLTIFLEDNEKWLNQVKSTSPHLQIFKVDYGTHKGRDADILLDTFKLGNKDILSLNLPNIVRSTKWDIILVDAPAGWGDSHPCRMKSIYEAYNLPKNQNVNIFVHDSERDIEVKYSNYFLKPNYKLTQEIIDPPGKDFIGRKLSHYQMEM